MQARRGNIPWKLVCVLALSGALLWEPCAFASNDSLEYQVKAAFLLNFIKFIDWPASAFADPGSPVAICILGEDPFGHALDQVVEGETVNGRKVALQRIKRAPPAKSCQVLFIAKSEKDNPKTILSDLPPGILTVGEGEGFMRAGGMIAFVIENRRVRFDINRAAAEKAALKLSSKLLSVARTVEK
jgi:hypothetical protein